MSDNSDAFHEHLATLRSIEKPDQTLAHSMCEWARLYQSQIARLHHLGQEPPVEMRRSFEVYKAMHKDFVKLLHHHDRVSRYADQLTNLYELSKLRKN